MSCLRQALLSRDMKWMRRALQFGDRHASFPLLFCWDDLCTELRKFVMYRLVHFQPGSPASTLQLLPCSLLDFIDFLEWLPSAGVGAGWKSVRHYAGQLSAMSHVCGFGSIVDYDRRGYEVWRENFSANCAVSVAPRGGDIPLRPWHLRRFIKVYSSGSKFDKMMLAACSQLWFTALRVGHFSPESNATKDKQHLLQWAHLHPYQSHAGSFPRPAMHYIIDSSKTRQKEHKEQWSTASCCICHGAEGALGASAEELADLTALCPICSLERWRRCAPSNAVYVCCDPETGVPVLRKSFNKELQRALDIALDFIPADVRQLIIKKISAKSFRSGAATAIVTAGNAGFVAAAFLGHSDPKVTKQYYHKGDDSERLQAAPALTQGLLVGA
jgi:hypothetical protein